MKTALILNRRCIRHPQRGGAEVYTFEIAKALRSSGFQVEWFASRPDGLPSDEEIDGVRFVRKGNELTTHFSGFIYAVRTKHDLIIDVFNGIGFFMFPFRNSALLIYQLYREFWKAELGFLGYLFIPIENILLRAYKRRRTVTISASTRDDLQNMGFKDITIIHCGIDIEPLSEIPEKEESLSLIYLGRIKNTKNPEDAIKAFLFIQKAVPGARLRVVGDGPLLPDLKEKYGDCAGISFHGFVEPSEKYELLKKSHFMLIPSLREGWGITVIEANALGTPAIGYNVPGLRDSIVDGKTGMLVCNFEEMAEQVMTLWPDRKRREDLGHNALAWARTFTWDKTRADFIEFSTGVTSETEYGKGAEK
jgi:glycosyltransferase involved in cell wall biosynthesis